MGYVIAAGRSRELSTQTGNTIGREKYQEEESSIVNL